MDAITLLKNDHKSVEDLFKRYEKAGDRAYVEKRQIVDRIIEELSQHAAIEEQVFYPAARVTVPGAEDIALESIEEHHIVKWELSELETMDPHDERFDAKVTVLMENVRHHVEEEESDFFPKVRDELGRNQLNDLGDAMEGARKTAPTHPHPRSPQTPPANAVVGLVAGAVDRVGDTAKGMAQGTVTAAKDLVARLRRIPTSQPAPTGSSTTRRQSDGVRAAANSAADRVADTVARAESTAADAVDAAKSTTRAAASGAQSGARSATKGAAGTAKAAKSGAKATATSARKGAAATRSTAKRSATTTGRTAKKAASSTGRNATNAAKATTSKGKS